MRDPLYVEGVTAHHSGHPERPATAHGPDGEGPARGPTHGHGHGVPAGADRRWLTAALALIVGFLVVEFVIGLLVGSLALLTDSAHMLTDAAAIGMALVALRLAARPAWGVFTFGLRRAEILSAQANGLVLLLLAAWFVVEGVRRLIGPAPVEGAPVLLTALAGIVVNIAAAACLRRADRSSLAVRGAFLHVLGDLFAFVATAVAGVVVLLTGFTRADALAALLVAALMVHAGVGLVRDSGRVFLEAAPRGVDPDVIGAQLASLPGVTQVHDLHIWEIASGQPALSAHVMVVPGAACHAVQESVERVLHGEWGIRHTTLQVDHLGTATAADPPAHCADAHGPVHRPT